MNAINLKDLSLGNFDQVMQIDEVKGGCCLSKIIKVACKVPAKKTCKKSFSFFSKSSWGCKKRPCKPICRPTNPVGPNE